MFELVGASALRRRLQAAAARGLTRFVGRQPELDGPAPGAGAGGRPGTARWWRWWARPAWASRAWSMSLSTAHRTQGWRVLESASVSYGKATPYFPVIDLLKRYCHVEEQR